VRRQLAGLERELAEIHETNLPIMALCLWTRLEHGPGDIWGWPLGGAIEHREFHLRLIQTGLKQRERRLSTRSQLCLDMSLVWKECEPLLRLPSTKHA
jgi:hypothetical protein